MPATTPATILADRAVIRVSGEDVRGFLQGLVTNDMGLLAPGRPLWAALLTAQGKALFDFILWTDPADGDGDVLIVEPGAQVRRGDRVVVKTREGEVMAKVLHRQSPRAIELVSLNPEHPNRNFDIDEIDWIARIIWASQ